VSALHQSPPPVALVTGAGGAIGRQIAVRLGEDGYAVAALDVRLEAAETTADLLRREGRQSETVVADIASIEGINSAFDQVESSLGTVTALVNNAGVISLGPFEDISDAEWDRVMRVNLKAPLFVAIEFARRAKAAGVGGAIVNIGSVASKRVMMNRAHYCASKAGVITLTKGLALELADIPIRVNCIHPKGIESGMSGNWISARDGQSQVSSGGWLDNPEQKRIVYQSLPIGRHGQPADIAAAVSFLLSDAASWATGASLDVDGGYLAGDTFTI
jgi:NAD(P)-dependent dehydrogenase (short-subunit alcohol dehydrogenase family)